MTREERHIAVLNRLLENMDVYDSIQPTTERKKAIKAAIQALENHDTFMKYAYSQGKQDALSQEPCDDAVSRESVDRILRDMGVNCAYDMPSFWANKGKDYKVIPTKWHKGYQQAVADFDKRIRELPSVTPSRRKGHWITKIDDTAHNFPFGKRVECSECGQRFVTGDSVSRKYCPNCGAKMESEEQE